MLDIKEYKHQAELCVRCSFCKLPDMNYIKSARFSRICPIEAKNRFNLYSGHGLLHSALAELDGKLDFTPKLMDALWQCNLCGACDAKCKRNLDVEVQQVIETLRARCVEKGKILPEHKIMADNVRKSKNIYGLDSRERVKPSSAVSSKPEIIYFLGDALSYKRPGLADTTAQLLNKIGISFFIMDNEWSSGHEMFAIGELELGREMAEHNIQEIVLSGVRTVVVSDAECYKTLKVDYPRILGKSTTDMPYTVLHITEYIDQLMKEGKIKFSNNVPLKVTYHDSCNLGRLAEPWYHWEPRYELPNIAVGKKWRRAENGVYEQPRNILRGIPGIELTEMERNRDNAWCCGYGGGVGTAFKDFSLWTAGERAEEAKLTGAQAIVSCCPHCKDILSQAAEIKKTGMRVYDITEIILRAIK